MRRRTVLVLPVGVLAGTITGCTRDFSRREDLPVMNIYPQDAVGLRWLAEGVGGPNHSDPVLTVDEQDAQIVLGMTAFTDVDPDAPQPAIAQLLRIEFTLRKPKGSRVFRNLSGESVQVLPTPPP